MNAPLLPDSASTLAPRVDLLMAYVLGITAFFTVLVAGSILFLLIRYRAAAEPDRTRPPLVSLPLELAWTGLPLVLTMSVFAWGAELYIDSRRPPPDALEVHVSGRQWMWHFQHAEGRRELGELHVPVGRPVVLRMTSIDVIHSFFVPAFRVKQDVLPGRFTDVWFQATAPGRYRLFCTQYCGMAHSGMTGWIDVLSPADYQRWLAGR